MRDLNAFALALEVRERLEVAVEAAGIRPVAARRHHRHRSHDQLGLRPPAPVDRCLADPRLGRDALDRRACQPVGPNHLPRCGEDDPVRLLAARPATAPSTMAAAAKPPRTTRRSSHARGASMIAAVRMPRPAVESSAPIGSSRACSGSRESGTTSACQAAPPRRLARSRGRQRSGRTARAASHRWRGRCPRRVRPRRPRCRSPWPAPQRERRRRLLRGLRPNSVPR